MLSVVNHVAPVNHVNEWESFIYELILSFFHIISLFLMHDMEGMIYPKAKEWALRSRSIVIILSPSSEFYDLSRYFFRFASLAMVHLYDCQANAQSRGSNI